MNEEEEEQASNGRSSENGIEQQFEEFRRLHEEHRVKDDEGHKEVSSE